MNDTADLASAYAAELSVHLRGSSESVLLHAYELGRRALGEGLGVLDIVQMHHGALRTVAGAASQAIAQDQLDKASAFLIEVLSPIEMQFRGYHESIADLTEVNEQLRQAKAEIETANRDLESFSYSVAHDLRAPLRSIDGFSLALLEDQAEKLGDEGRQSLYHLREIAHHMKELIEDLLSLSQVTRAELTRRRVDLTSIAQDVAARLRQQNPDRKVRCDIAKGLVAEGDERLLGVALDNLLGNAWKFTSKCASARIQVGVAKNGSQPTYFIRDNGAGFDMAYEAKLFAAFQRLHSAREFDGTGIGLAIVQRVIQRHGGHIWAKGEVGRGATFFFNLGEGATPDNAMPPA
jgi:light-regulated signal transduction histidine kinase (bacteriophytochrome)